VLRRETARGCHALDLCQHEPAAVPGGLGDGEHFAEERFVLHGHVPALVGGGPANEPDMYRERAVEEPFAPRELDDLHQVLGGPVIELSTAIARVHESLQADVSDEPRPPRCDLAKQVADHALGPVVRLD